jgi:DNA polymerase (family X)
MENVRIAEILEEIADLLELKRDNPFRVRSYRNAAQAVRGFTQRIEDMAEEGEDLKSIPEIGESIAKKIVEILDTGSCRKLKMLHKQIPTGLPDLMKIPGLGPRKVKEMYDELDISSIAELKEACENKRIRDLEGFGEKTEKKILQGIETVGATSGRILLKEASEFAESIVRYLKDLESIDRWEVAGSFRRRKETIGDLDILVSAIDREQAGKEILDFEEIEHVIGEGKEKISVTLKAGLQVDFRFFTERSFGAALLYFTGSKSHNIALRKIARKKGWKLNEYGMFSGEKLLAGKSEEDIYSRLGCDYIPPELREDNGELEAARTGTLPDLIEAGDINGDFHAHTNATDGHNTIREMAAAAREQGHTYLAITDHSKAVRMAKGLNDEQLRKHADAIREVDADLDKFWLLAGVEVDILKDGSLDISENVLADLDWVCASIHSYFDLDEKKMTDRIVKAIKSGVVDCIGHPLGRMLGRRDPIAVDIDAVFEACRENNVCLEINAEPDRMDLPANHARHAAAEGVKLTIGTDAHSTSDLVLMEYGVAVARRGWLTSGNVLNTLNLTDLRKELGNRRNGT